MAVWGGLTNSCERREVKSKVEKEGYKHLNAEFQRIGRRPKKAFLNDQCKEIEENNRIGKTKDLFRRRRWHPTPVLLPGKSHGWRSLVGAVHEVMKSWTRLKWLSSSRDLFKKIRDTKGTFHAKMGSTKDRNGRDLTEAEDIKKRWQEYTEELYKKDLHGPDNHNGMITHLEPDILECEVKWALENHHYKQS